MHRIQGRAEASVLISVFPVWWQNLHCTVVELEGQSPSLNGDAAFCYPPFSTTTTTSGCWTGIPIAVGCMPGCIIIGWPFTSNIGCCIPGCIIMGYCYMGWPFASTIIGCCMGIPVASTIIYCFMGWPFASTIIGCCMGWPLASIIGICYIMGCCYIYIGWPLASIMGCYYIYIGWPLASIIGCYCYILF